MILIVANIRSLLADLIYIQEAQNNTHSFLSLSVPLFIETVYFLLKLPPTWRQLYFSILFTLSVILLLLCTDDDVDDGDDDNNNNNNNFSIFPLATAIHFT